MEDLTEKWVDNYYQGLSFVLNKGVLETPIRLGMVELYQVGEIGLNSGGKVFEHKQVCCEINYVISGEGYFTVNGVKTKVKKGDIHIVPADSVHEVEAEKYTNFRYSYIGFRLIEELDKQRYAPIIEFYRNPPAEARNDTENVHYALDTMVDELYAEHQYFAEIFEACATQFVIQCFKLYENKPRKYYIPEFSKKKVGEIAYDIVRYIDSQILEIKNVSALAARMGYTSDYLSRVFKEKTGISIQKYMQNKKIDYGMELLKSEKHSVKEVAATLNYESTQAFSKIFKKHTGYTPSEYISVNKPKEQK